MSNTVRSIQHIIPKWATAYRNDPRGHATFEAWFESQLTLAKARTAYRERPARNNFTLRRVPTSTPDPVPNLPSSHKGYAGASALVASIGQIRIICCGRCDSLKSGFIEPCTVDETGVLYHGACCNCIAAGRPEECEFHQNLGVFNRNPDKRKELSGNMLRARKDFCVRYNNAPNPQPHNDYTSVSWDGPAGERAPAQADLVKAFGGIYVDPTVSGEENLRKLQAAIDRVDRNITPHGRSDSSPTPSRPRPRPRGTTDDPHPSIEEVLGQHHRGSTPAGPSRHSKSPSQSRQSASPRAPSEGVLFTQIDDEDLYGATPRPSPGQPTQSRHSSHSQRRHSTQPRSPSEGVRFNQIDDEDLYGASPRPSRSPAQQPAHQASRSHTRETSGCSFKSALAHQGSGGGSPMHGLSPRASPRPSDAALRREEGTPEREPSPESRTRDAFILGGKHRHYKPEQGIENWSNPLDPIFHKYWRDGPFTKKEQGEMMDEVFDLILRSSDKKQLCTDQKHRDRVEDELRSEFLRIFDTFMVKKQDSSGVTVERTSELAIRAARVADKYGPTGRPEGRDALDNAAFWSTVLAIELILSDMGHHQCKAVIGGSPLIKISWLSQRRLHNMVPARAFGLLGVLAKRIDFEYFRNKDSWSAKDKRLRKS